MTALFSNITLNAPRGPLDLSNRIVIAPMCQYSADEGRATDWHLMHWGNLLNGGAAMLILEATAVTARGRITPHCLGLWDDTTAAALQDTLHRARRLAPQVPVCIQLAHAGRKGSSAAPWHGGQLLDATQGGWWPEGPSALPHLESETAPEEISAQGLIEIRHAFVQAAERAQAMGIEAIELHAAHGYLLHQFLSPLANQRNDGYGGNFEARIRFPSEVFHAVRQVYRGTLGIRLSATDWVEGGWTPEETADFTLRLKSSGLDYVHISSAGVSPLQKIAVGPEYQVPFAKLVKQKNRLAHHGGGIDHRPAPSQRHRGPRRRRFGGLGTGVFVQAPLGLGGRSRLARQGASLAGLLALPAT